MMAGQCAPRTSDMVLLLCVVGVLVAVVSAKPKATELPADPAIDYANDPAFSSLPIQSCPPGTDYIKIRVFPKWYYTCQSWASSSTGRPRVDEDDDDDDDDDSASSSSTGAPAAAASSSTGPSGVHQFCSQESVCLKGSGQEQDVGTYEPHSAAFAIRLWITLALELENLGSPAARAALLARDLARCVTPPLPPSRVHVLSVVSGSTVATFDILPGAGSSTTAAAIQILAQVSGGPNATNTDNIILANAVSSNFKAVQMALCEDGTRWSESCLPASNPSSNAPLGGHLMVVLVGVGMLCVLVALGCLFALWFHRRQRGVVLPAPIVHSAEGRESKGVVGGMKKAAPMPIPTLLVRSALHGVAEENECSASPSHAAWRDMGVNSPRRQSALANTLSTVASAASVSAPAAAIDPSSRSHSRHASESTSRTTVDLAHAIQAYNEQLAAKHRSQFVSPLSAAQMRLARSEMLDDHEAQVVRFAKEAQFKAYSHRSMIESSVHEPMTAMQTPRAEPLSDSMQASATPTPLFCPQDAESAPASTLLLPRTPLLVAAPMQLPALDLSSEPSPSSSGRKTLPVLFPAGARPRPVVAQEAVFSPSLLSLATVEHRVAPRTNAAAVAACTDWRDPNAFSPCPSHTPDEMIVGGALFNEQAAWDQPRLDDSRFDAPIAEISTLQNRLDTPDIAAAAADAVAQPVVVVHPEMRELPICRPLSSLDVAAALGGGSTRVSPTAAQARAQSASSGSSAAARRAAAAAFVPVMRHQSFSIGGPVMPTSSSSSTPRLLESAKPPLPPASVPPRRQGFAVPGQSPSPVGWAFSRRQASVSISAVSQQADSTSYALSLYEGNDMCANNDDEAILSARDPPRESAQSTVDTMLSPRSARNAERARSVGFESDEEVCLAPLPSSASGSHVRIFAPAPAPESTQ